MAQCESKASFEVQSSVITVYSNIHVVLEIISWNQNDRCDAFYQAFPERMYGSESVCEV